MPLGLTTTFLGPAVSPSLGLRQSIQDDADDVAVQFGADLLVRIDPRDVRLTADNPTGQKRIHYMAPNRDPLLFSASGCAVAPIAGKYAGKTVFGLTPGALPTTKNDLSIGPKSLNGITEFSMMGVAHFDAGMLGTSGFHVLAGMYRDRSSLESVVVHQFIGGVDYLTVMGDQGDGGGANYNITTGGLISAGVPFVYLARIKGTSTGNSRVALHLNQVAAENAVNTGAGIPEAGSIEIMLGHLTTTDQQWSGAHARGYVFRGDILDTPDRAALAADLMMQLRVLYGVA